MKGKYLITTDGWFYAPDGRKYRSVWGEAKILEDSFLGVATNRNSTNWYAFIGSEENGMLVAGCQIHYAVKCEKKPNTDEVREFMYDQNSANVFERPCEIYIAE